MPGLGDVGAVLHSGVGTTYPAAALACGRGRIELELAVGAAEVTTWFDLASLTKALATSVLAMRLHDAGKLDLDEPVQLGGAAGPTVRLWHLLAHCSGLPAGPPPLWAEAQGLLAAPSASSRQTVVHMATHTAPAPAAQTSVYSDLGFIILGDLLERRTGSRLDEQFRQVAAALALAVAYRPLDAVAPVAAAPCAPTRRESPARELVLGQVHDDNARAMLGVAGHAGLFGTAAGVHRFATALLDAYHDVGTPAQRALAIDSATVRRFFAPCTQAGLTSTWGLGWDHPDPLPLDGRPSSSSAGPLWPRTGVGHLGFTGCALWLDLERRGVAVFLSNRVCVATNEQAAATKAQLRALRPALNDAIQRAWRADP